MYKRLTVILFYIAGVVLVLHNITPHVHLEESDPIESPTPDSLIDWLAFAFQIDPGAGHLEWFSKSDPVDADEPQLYVSYSLANRDSIVEEQGVVVPPSPILESHFAQTNYYGASGLRGPPLV